MLFPASKNLFKVRKISLEQCSVNISDEGLNQEIKAGYARATRMQAKS